MLSEEDKNLIDLLAEKVVSWHMGVPAIFFLEMHKPLSFVGSQFMIILGPIAHVIFAGDKYDRMAKILSHRDNVELLITLIEHHEKKKGKKKLDDKR